MPDLVLLTVEDLRNWLLHNRAVAGLSERIISRTRAWAIINNPYVQDKDPVIAMVLVEGHVAAYTTAFPEMIREERQWWFSALWCDPEYRGQGYGLIVIGSLAEVYGVEHCLDRWGATDTVGIFTYLGHQTIYTPRFIFGSRIKRKTVKGKVLYLSRVSQAWLHELVRGYKRRVDYTLCYLPYIDDETYAFMRAHQGNDCFVHTQEMLNWELQYSFTISAPLIERVGYASSSFPSEMADTRLYVVQVRDKEGIVGFYVMKRNDDSLHLLYLYYAEKAEDAVFASIVDHISILRIMLFDTDHEALAAYIRRHVYFPKFRTIDISFSFPEGFPSPSDKSMQYGDGDNFAIIS